MVSLQLAFQKVCLKKNDQLKLKKASIAVSVGCFLNIYIYLHTHLNNHMCCPPLFSCRECWLTKYVFKSFRNPYKTLRIQLFHSSNRLHQCTNRKEMDHWQPEGSLDHNLSSLSVSSAARGPSADVKIMNLSPFIVMFEELLKVSPPGVRAWSFQPSVRAHNQVFVMLLHLYLKRWFNKSSGADSKKPKAILWCPSAAILPSLPSPHSLVLQI